MLAATLVCAALLQDVTGDKRRLTLGPDKRVELDFQHYYASHVQSPIRRLGWSGFEARYR